MTGEIVHRLGTAGCAAAAVLWLACAFGGWRYRRRHGARLTAVLGTVPPPSRPEVPGALRGPVGRERLRRWLTVAGAACAGFLAVGGVPGLVVGVLAGELVRRLRPRQVPADACDLVRAARELPLAADLLAACIAAGADPVAASRAVGESLGGPVGERLARGAAEVRLGGEPAEAWRDLAALPGAEPLARLLARAGDSGAPAAAPVARIATAARESWGRAATARARRAGVLITVPVGICFLPAFLAIGVLPVVIGLAGRLLGGGSP
ncbi:type II secretion system F family protein [Streptomyces sp. NPDC058045]|uniref:type II secretion system F family protein n=1 Tax=Streptomyces sp. NPDC058045 TaxID=3346311 RepID=UPI0036EB718B